MDGNTQTDLNSLKNRNGLSNVFPDLKNDENFEILSPQTSKYNCIAWAMQLTDRWVSIYDLPGYWWPDGVEKSMSSTALIQAFEAVGFVKCEDSRIEKGFDKVVLYRNEHTNQWTHAARVISETTEYSKFGQSWDGTHSHNVLCKTGLGYENQSYGVAYAFMKRSVEYKFPHEKLSGKIETDLSLLRGLMKIDK